MPCATQLLNESVNRFEPAVRSTGHGCNQAGLAAQQVGQHHVSLASKLPLPVLQLAPLLPPDMVARVHTSTRQGAAFDAAQFCFP